MNALHLLVHVPQHEGVVARVLVPLPLLLAPGPGPRPGLSPVVVPVGAGVRVLPPHPALFCVSPVAFVEAVRVFLLSDLESLPLERLFAGFLLPPPLLLGIVDLGALAVDLVPLFLARVQVLLLFGGKAGRGLHDPVVEGVGLHVEPAWVGGGVPEGGGLSSDSRLP